MRRLAFLLYSLLVIAAGEVKAQAPMSLSIAPDARAAGIGNAGLATTPDAAAQHWNVAKYAFADDPAGLQLSYIPWMPNLAGGMNILYLSGYKIFGTQAVSASLHYFSAGEIVSDNEWTDYTASPVDWAVDVGYSKHFGRWFSLGVAFRYVMVDYMKRDRAFSLPTARTLAADIGACFRLPVAFGEWTFGAALTNAGGKLEMGEGHHLALPANAGAGMQVAWSLKDPHRVLVAIDVNKPLTGKNNTSGHAFDTPHAGGGVEYSYAQQIALRAGYHYTGSGGNNRSYLTVGAGVYFRNIRFDIAYWATTGRRSVALHNTLHFSLGYTFASRATRPVSDEQPVP
ncbi:MAG: PorV/PorQ family protein [Prevotellaceae bacterium]|jgi:hypothetical protein|nr:PorV/PorQ family protein [Prevotellaceae bacterium]